MMKKFFLSAISFLLVLSLCGCGADAVLESAATTPTTTFMVTDTPVLTPSPTIMSTPNPPVSATSAGLQTQLAKAPVIDGLTKTIQDGSVIYTYNEGNPYSGATGEYAGVYKENVFVEGEQVGGVCLSANVCLVMLNNALAEIPDGEDKIKIAFPVDITNLKDMDNFNIFDIVENDGSDFGIMFQSSSSFNVVNCLPYEEQPFCIGHNSVDISIVPRTGDNIPFSFTSMDSIYSVANSFSSSECMHFLNLGMPSESVARGTEIVASFGDPLGCKVNSLFLFIHDANRTYSIINVSDLLTVDGKVVFIEEN